MMSDEPIFPTLRTGNQLRILERFMEAIANATCVDELDKIKVCVLETERMLDEMMLNSKPHPSKRYL